jgi:hypothetical protein
MNSICCRVAIYACPKLLNSIIVSLVSNDFQAAASAAELGMGKSAMGKHRGTGSPPGWFMTDEMRLLGWNMHDSAFSRVAKKGNMNDTLNSLQGIIGSCVACHYAYRTR